MRSECKQFEICGNIAKPSAQVRKPTALLSSRPICRFPGRHVGPSNQSTVDPTGQACSPAVAFLRPPSFEFFCIGCAVGNRHLKISGGAKFFPPAPLGSVGPVGAITFQRDQRHTIRSWSIFGYIRFVPIADIEASLAPLRDSGRSQLPIAGTKE
jgi:hypothetical protein